MSLFTRILASCAIFAFTVGPVSAATAPDAKGLAVEGASNGQTASIIGAITDSSGAPLEGATVVIRGGGKSYTATSDAHGTFAIANIPPGLYSVTATRAGYETASEQSFAVLAQGNAPLQITMPQSTFTALHTIATVRTTARGVFNTSPASVNIVTSEQFLDQGQPQVTRVLNQIPGVQISLPSSSANGAVPGAITFPNIRGGLSYETASLIDGHPLSVGKYGDYVTTFLNSFMFQSVEVIKGPGADSPQVNYAINGTANFRTKDPTATPNTDFAFGFTNHGGSYYNFGVSDTVNNLGFVVDIAGMDEPSAVNGAKVNFLPTQNRNAAICNPGQSGNGCYSFYSPTSYDSASYIPGTASKYYNQFGVVACCAQVYGDYNNISELVKLRYSFTPSTSVTVSYLGSQTTANQNGNTTGLVPGVFNPGVGYIPLSGQFAPGAQVLMSNFNPGGQETETNNEPILQGEVRTTLGNDTVLGRYYHAGIQRIINGGGTTIDTPTTVYQQLWGYAPNGSGGFSSYSGQTVPLKYYNFYNQSEIDSLSGFSFEYDHPMGQNNTLTFAWDSTNSQTNTGTLSSDDAYQQGPVVTGSPFWGSILPVGSGQIFNTFMLRDRANIGDKLGLTATLYSNTYNATFPIAAPPGGQTPNASGWVFGNQRTSHFDERLAATYRLNPDTSLRFSAGSAIAPPYINLLNKVPGSISTPGGGVATQTWNFLPLVPETAFGYDLGADVRMKNNLYFSGDVYLNNLYNAFITQVFDRGLVDVGGAQAELYVNSATNLNNARYEGVEAMIRRVTPVGLNFRAAAGLQKGYAYNLPQCFYANTAGCGNNANLAIVPGANFSGNAINSSSTLNGFSNQSLPYFTGNAEISYRFANGAYAAFGGTLYGKNNSLYEPPFTIAYATARYPLTQDVSLQISGDNIFNTLSGLFPIYGGGVPIPLAGVPSGAPAGTPAIGATYGNVLGPATWRFVLMKTFGAVRNDDGRSRNSSR